MGERLQASLSGALAGTCPAGPVGFAPGLRASLGQLQGAARFPRTVFPGLQASLVSPQCCNLPWDTTPHVVSFPKTVPYPDASCAALGNSVRDGGTGRVDHGDEAGEAEAAGGEVWLLGVEGEAGRELPLIQVQVTET